MSTWDKAKADSQEHFCIDQADGDCKECARVERLIAAGDQLQAENERLREALKEIADPIAAMKKEAEQQGFKPDGRVIVEMAANPQWFREKARAAIKDTTQ